MEALFIVNPRSADGTTGSQWPRLERMIAREGLRGAVRFTEGPGHATQLTREGLTAGHRLIVTVGGDGTINETVNGFFDMEGNPLAPEAELGLIGRGTGCDFIKSLGIPKREDLAVRRILGGSPQAIDLGRVTFHDAAGRERMRYFGNIAEVGLGGAVVERVNRASKRFGGFASFLMSTLATIATYQNRPMTLQIDDASPETLVAVNLVVGNGCYFGGGMRILPGAELDDGWLDVLIMGDLARLELFGNLAKVYRGTHLTHPKVRHLRARRLCVTSPEPLLLDVDGEQPGQVPATFTLQPAALRLRH
jgi:YegS/Rv2252/BmrU family lipid kinase